MVLGNLLSEIFKWIRLIIWLTQYILLIVWYRFFRCMNRDDTVDRIAEDVEHKHPVEDIWWGRRPKNIRPKTFHQKEAKVDPVPIFYPKTKSEIQALVKSNPRFRAIGSGHSFRGVVETNGVLISLEDMNRVLSVQDKTVTVEAGIKIRDAIRVLEDNNLAIRNMGNYDRQSLGGAICGGTHGTSGEGKIDTFTSSIVSLKMINAKGEDVELTPEESVNFGLGGIIYEVTLNLTSFYYLKEKRTPVPAAGLSTVDFNEWWTSGSEFTMARWNFPGREYGVFQLVEFMKRPVEEYEKDRNEAYRDRLLRVFLFKASPFLPEIIHRLSPSFFGAKAFVDKYYLQYVDDPAPHHTEWEYAVPYEKAQEILPLIPEAVKHIKYTVEVHIRSSPKDKAKAHLAHKGDVIWYDLNVITPEGLSEEELNAIAKPFEDLMVARGGVAHPHKLAVDITRAGLSDDTIQFLTQFQKKHDPEKKMMNPALARMMKQAVPASATQYGAI